MFVDIYESGTETRVLFEKSHGSVGKEIISGLSMYNIY